MAPTSVATPLPRPSPVTEPLRDGLVNLAHLQRLTEVVRWEEEPVALVHIYSEHPNYNWVDAPGEGIAAVDDVARAALVYLDFYARTGDKRALELARVSLNFVMRLQAEDGEYYNFVFDRAGTINREGRTSYKSWSWWAARGQWALARGYAVFRAVDADYAARLQTHYLRGEQALRRTLGPVGAYDVLHGVRVPAWLLHNGSDLSALAVLGLAAYYEAEPNSGTRQLLTNLANGVAAYQLSEAGVYPYGAHPSTTTSLALWHAWGSHQVHALAVAGQLLEREDWIASAQQAADDFFVRLLATRFLNEMTPLPMPGGQIAYGTQVIALGFQALYEATGEARYARYAGLAASWFFGNNIAAVPMYDPETGRCFDGIGGPNMAQVNRNAGAESTIEALYTLLRLERTPEAQPYLTYRAVETPPHLVVEMENGEKIAGEAKYGRQVWTGEARFSNERYYALGPGDAVALPFRVPTTAAYVISVAHLRRAAPRLASVAEAVRAPASVTIDGDLAEWDAAQPLEVNTRAQILRGAAAWPGPEEAGFTLYWMWDTTHLYVAARVRDPQHVQEETGPSAWRGDALWLYLDTQGRGERIDVKLTLAQTPDGPQVWNWVAQSFLPGAELAWAPTGDGYVYEAALPLESLPRLSPAAGKQMRFEAGMGFTGGFIDWTGHDPDIPGNLAPLAFVTQRSPAAARPAEAAEQAPEDVAFTVALDDEPEILVPQAVSPDRDYLWLEPLDDGAFFLEAGEHTLTVTFAGKQTDRRAVIDAFEIVPRLLCKTHVDDRGHTLTLCYDALTGATHWEETP
ncbi:MAG: sugar-binding protein [Anaerolineae bacterium]